MNAPTVVELWEQYGCSVIPVKLDKKPAWSLLPQRFDDSEQRMKGQWKPYQKRQPTADEISCWIEANPPAFAIITGEISNRVIFDFDGTEGVALAEKWGVDPHRRTGSGGLHLDVVYPGWFVPTLNGKAKKELGQRWPGLDVKGDHGYCLAIGRNENGPYEWLRDPQPDPMDVVPAEVWEFLEQHSKSKQHTNGTGRNGNGAQHIAPIATVAGRVDPERLIVKAVEAAPSVGRNNAGFDLACQLRDNGYSKSEAKDVMRRYRSRVPPVNMKGQNEPYSDSEANGTVRGVFNRPARQPWTLRRTTARETHPTPSRLWVAKSAKDVPNPPRPELRDRTSPPNLLSDLSNDHGNACRLIAMHGGDLRYCHGFKKWLVWDGMRWAVDVTDQARRLGKQTMLEFLRQTVDIGTGEQAEKFARSCLDAHRITTMLKMAECEIFIQPADLDTDPYLLNFQNGTVDLRTGRLRPHERQDFITKLVHYDYQPGTPCPLWHAFLERMMGGGPDAGEGALERAKRLTDYLQRALGYSLTGCTIEKAVFVLFGEGDNGKSTMLSTFRHILEEYAVLMQVDTLMVRQESNNTQADLADLRGARFVQTSESEEGQRLAQGKLKRITQGMGKIKAVRKYENPIEFPETHKLWIDTNRKPTIGDADDNATFNRLHPIPFTVRIPKELVDKEMPTKLLREAEGIAAWAVQGAKLWHESGLNKPPEVDAAKNEWRAEMDQIGRFIEDRCVVGDTFRALAATLYEAYKRWAEASGERKVLTSTAFGTKLSTREFENRHIEKTHNVRGAIYHGIALQPEPKEDRRTDGFGEN